MPKKLRPIIETKFNPETQPGYESRFGNFAFNRFFGDLQMGSVKPTTKSTGIENKKVVSDQKFFKSMQLPQTIPSRAYKKGKTP